mmetsp:Transcript_1244/g.4755  ORF Transcript_1244/g.4755 Transcript_1244/m.4755 type:complete len:201 (-) Transcript_1244:246-848(-)
MFFNLAAREDCSRKSWYATFFFFSNLFKTFGSSVVATPIPASPRSSLSTALVKCARTPSARAATAEAFCRVASVAFFFSTDLSVSTIRLCRRAVSRSSTNSVCFLFFFVTGAFRTRYPSSSYSSSSSSSELKKDSSASSPTLCRFALNFAAAFVSIDAFNETYFTSCVFINASSSAVYVLLSSALPWCTPPTVLLRSMPK